MGCDEVYIRIQWGNEMDDFRKHRKSTFSLLVFHFLLFTFSFSVSPAFHFSLLVFHFLLFTFSFSLPGGTSKGKLEKLRRWGK